MLGPGSVQPEMPVPLLSCLVPARGGVFGEDGEQKSFASPASERRGLPGSWRHARSKQTGRGLAQGSTRAGPRRDGTCSPAGESARWQSPTCVPKGPAVILKASSLCLFQFDVGRKVPLVNSLVMQFRDCPRKAVLAFVRGWQLHGKTKRCLQTRPYVSTDRLGCDKLV